MATTGKEPIELFGKSVHGALSFLDFLTVVNSGNKFIFWRNVDTLTTTGNGTKLKKKTRAAMVPLTTTEKLSIEAHKTENRPNNREAVICRRKSSP